MRSSRLGDVRSSRLVGVVFNMGGDFIPSHSPFTGHYNMEQYLKAVKPINIHSHLVDSRQDCN